MVAFATTLDHLVTIQRLEAGQDAYGSPSTTWIDVNTVWASVSDVTGREFLAAGGTQNLVTTKIVIRALEGVVATMRVVDGADIYNIEVPLRQDRGTLLLMCSRGVANG